MASMMLPMGATLIFCVGIWSALIEISRVIESPWLYRTAEVIAGAAGLVTMWAYMPIARGLVLFGEITHPYLWALKWTGIMIVASMMATTGLKVMLERNGVWEPVNGVEERRKFDIHE